MVAWKRSVTSLMRPKKTSWMYRILYFFVNLFFPRLHLVGQGWLPDEPCVIVGNHSQIHGPLASELRLDFPHETWCAGEMMRRDEVSAYAFRDFWSFKPRWTLPFYRLLSKLITPLAICLFNNAHTIPVYHDIRLRNTFRLSLEALNGGESLVIFPEKNEKYNHILYAFQDKFIDLARYYYKQSGKRLSFVPMYLAPSLRSVFFGEAIVFDPDAPIETERKRICNALSEAITALADAQPLHTVVPYRNIPRRDYPHNHPQGEQTP